MTGPVTMSQQRTIPVAPQETFARTLELPLPELFRKRYGPIPAIRATEGDTPWNTPGQRRRIVLADGGTMQESLLTVEPPHRFTYVLTDLTGPLSPLVERIEGTWAFEPAGTGTRVTWTWVAHPKSGWARPLLVAFAVIWGGYAKRALEELSEALLR